METHSCRDTLRFACLHKPKVPLPRIDPICFRFFFSFNLFSVYHFTLCEKHNKKKKSKLSSLLWAVQIAFDHKITTDERLFNAHMRTVVMMVLNLMWVLECFIHIMPFAQEFPSFPLFNIRL